MIHLYYEGAVQVDQTSIELLEFPKVKEILAGFTSFSASRELALNLTPSADVQLVSLLLKQSAEARRLLALSPGFSIDGMIDVREEVKMASRGKVLSPSALLDIQNSLRSTRSLRDDLSSLKHGLPLLWDIASGIKDLSFLEAEIRRCLTPTGEIIDSATEKLLNLRQQIRKTREELMERLKDIIESRQSQNFLQEPLITTRHDRYVIPVKAELRKGIRGIVHDISNTGSTVFVEPWSTVELGNQLRELMLSEEQEKEKILGDLSAQVGAYAAEISRNIELTAEIDLALAKARYANKVNATEPIVTGTSKTERTGTNINRLSLVAARHPLLGENAVPLSVEIGSDFSILVISGPNAGGKTVALKTIGLLTLMTQAGMPIPASPESFVPVFDGVFADIGDEQSIEQMLSSFTWHMGNIIRIIQNSTRNSLVLLDELGTSTDPVEGVALAQSILLKFLSKGNLVVATTHYSGLKVFAHQTPGLKNASLDFDPVTLKPTYHLTMGVPGGSNALSIASQLGMEPEIIAVAKKFMSQGHLEMERLLSELTEEKRKAETLCYSLQRDRDETRKLKEELEKRLQKLETEERNILCEVKNRLMREAALLEKELREAVKELKKERAEASIEQAKRAVARMEEHLESKTWQAQRSYYAVVDSPAIAVGDRVRLIETGLDGLVMSLSEDGSNVEVQAGDIRLWVKVENVEKVMPGVAEAVLPSLAAKTSRGRVRSRLELDLRGKRVDEIEPKLDLYLNDAFVSGLSQVRIIHGFGTGIVRQVVHRFLRGHPLVESFNLGGKGEGGGATIVKLRSSKAL